MLDAEGNSEIPQQFGVGGSSRWRRR
jgi:hypothetical protein